jgi:hypothetical protein
VSVVHHDEADDARAVARRGDVARVGTAADGGGDGGEGGDEEADRATLQIAVGRA